MKFFNFKSIETYVANHLKLFLSMAAAIVVFVVIIAVSVFFVSVRGAEQTMVPDVTGKELSSALLELQVKELYPRIQMRFSQSPQEKGLILEQEPNPGTIVKAGRRIRLVVSQGVLINRIESYIGRNIDEVILELQTMFASESGVPLVSIKEPIMYQFSTEAAGTILQQSPESGTGISGPTPLELVVSKGQEDTLVHIPSLISLSLEEALDELGISGIAFTFTVGTGSEGAPLTVTAQYPAGDSRVRADTRVSVTINPPSALDPGEVFGIFKYEVAKNPYPLAMRLEAQLPTGEQRTLLTTEFSGGELTVPYKLPAGTVIVIYMLDREIYRQTVASPLEQQLDRLTLDQF